MRRFFSKRWVVSVAVLAAGMLAFRPVVLPAAVVPPQATVSGSGGLSSLLDNPEIMQRLESLGYQRDQVREVIAALTPTERAALEEKMELLAGGGAGNVLLTALVVSLVVVITILIILKATGYQLKVETKAG